MSKNQRLVVTLHMKVAAQFGGGNDSQYIYNKEDTMKTIRDIPGIQEVDIREMLAKEMKPFSPVAYYDENLDLIRVKLRDCSVLESRVNGWFTILRDNHPKEGQSRCIGLTIKGVKHLFDEFKMPKNQILTVVHILNTILDNIAPEDALDKITIADLQPCKNILIETDLSVDMRLAA